MGVLRVGVTGCLRGLFGLVLSFFVLVSAPEMTLAQPAQAQPPKVKTEAERAKARETVLLAYNANRALGFTEPLSIGNSAKFAYDQQVWDLADQWSRNACEGNDAQGCAVLGLVLAEGRVRAPDPKAAEVAHRKAAALYINACNAQSVSIGERCVSAGDFFQVIAVPAVKDPAKARSAYQRAKEAYIKSCETGAYDCFKAGLLTAGSYTGQSDPVKALALYRRGCDAKSERSDQEASCDRLINLLVYGGAEVQNTQEARERIAKNQCSVSKLYPPADKAKSLRGDKLYCAILADLLFDGLGGPADPKKAEQLMRMSCALGQDSACKVLETRNLGRDDYKAAVALRDLGFTYQARDLFETRCTAQDGLACNEAGRLTINDQPEKGRRFYARSCTLGNAVGCYNSGVQLRRLGGADNLVAARAAFQKACEAKDAPACWLYGVMLAAGEGGPKDQVEANRVYTFACDNRNAAACNNLGNIYKNGLDVAVDLVKARALFEKACELGDGNGCNNGGITFAKGEGGAVDDTKARSLYQKACDKNIGAGCNNLGVLLRDGRGGPVDHVAARKQFERSCNLGFSCNSYSDSLLSSLGGPIDRNKAIQMRIYSCLQLKNSEACQWIKEGGHSDPIYEGTLLTNQKKYDQALPLFQTACNQGKAEGCRGLGVVQYALSKPTDGQASLTKACNMSDAIGCSLLADMTPASPEAKLQEKLKLKQRACTLGNADACTWVKNFEERYEDDYW